MFPACCSLGTWAINRNEVGRGGASDRVSLSYTDFLQIQHPSFFPSCPCPRADSVNHMPVIHSVLLNFPLIFGSLALKCECLFCYALGMYEKDITSKMSTECSLESDLGGQSLKALQPSYGATVPSPRLLFRDPVATFHVKRAGKVQT